MSPEYFERRSIPEPNTGCWLWEGAVSKDNGYGRMNYLGKNRNAHRVSWIVHHGDPIPDGMLVCHKCDVRTCVNPDHLFLGTNQDNMLDMVRKGRAPTAYDIELVRIVRRLRGTMTRRQIGDAFGLSRRVVHHMHRRKTMKWVS